MKLSIIVPIYNVEAYISRCATSLYNQTASKDDYEVVFVNDGTKDNSIRILRDTINFDATPNFHIVEKANGGLSSARNYGINHSSGDYIWFVDSDDWVDSDSVEVLLSAIGKNPDVVVTTQLFTNQGDVQGLKYSVDCDFQGSGSELMKICQPDCAVLYICKREFLNRHGFRFYEGILHEDSELSPRLLYSAKSAIGIKRPLYHYFMREGSIMHVYNQKRITSYFIVLKSLMDFYNTSVKDEDKSTFASRCTPHIYGLLDVASLAPSDMAHEVNGYFVKYPLLGKMMKMAPGTKAHIFGSLIKLFPSRTLSIYKLLRRLKG